MQFNLVMPFRPLSSGNCTCPQGEIHQLDDLTWEAIENHKLNKKICASHRVNINQAIDTLNKRSVFKHNIIVVLDSDVFPNKNWLKEFDNVKVMKSSYIFNEPNGVNPYFYKLAAALRDGFMTLNDEDWLCYIYLDDWICNKNWDKFIVDAIIKYGDDKVYTPMFIEPYSDHFSQTAQGIDFSKEIPTFDKIWNKWRKEICCHSLTMPISGIGYIEEKAFEEYVKIASRDDLQIELCGVRNYGYYAAEIMKAKYAKKLGMKLGPGFDTDFDGRLGLTLGLNKVVVTNSFILHTKYQRFKFNE